MAATICGPAFSQSDPIAAIEARVSLGVAVRGEPEKTASLEERMQELSIPAVSIAVVNNGQLEWAKAHGYADKEDRTLVTPGTLLQATAISSAVSAMAAIKLVEDGRLELLNHTAGMNGGGFGGYQTETALPSIAVADDGCHPRTAASARAVGS